MKRNVSLIVFLLILGCLLSTCLGKSKKETKVQSNQKFNPDLFLRSLAIKESGMNPNAWGDLKLKLKAWGMFQFQKRTWIRFGGKPTHWGKKTCGVNEQTLVMQNALKVYSAGFKSSWTPTQKITWAASWHNRGHGSLTPSPYTRDVVSIYRKEMK